MSLKIIGAGFPRTGTTTLKSALQTLGYHKTYHMTELFMEPKRLKNWLELEKKGKTDFDSLFIGFSASVDLPGYPYYKILMEQYPEAKVILTKRNFEDWYLSVNKTVVQAGPQTVGEKLSMLSRMLVNSRLRNKINCIKFAHDVFLHQHFGGLFADKEHARKVYHQHLDEVQAYVPKEKLLVYEVADGWGPLCDFLGMDIPDEPFPHLNKKENFKQFVNDMIEDRIEIV